MKIQNEWKQALNRWLCGALGCALLLSGCGAGKTEKQEAKKQTTQTVSSEASADEKKQPFYTLMQEHKDLVSAADDWKKVDGKYQYPIDESSDSWIDMNDAELRYVACAIPKEIMSELSSKELLELVMDCPMFTTIQMQSTYYNGLVDYGKYFNGMYELMHRSDFYKTVVDYYQHMEIPKTLTYHPQLPDNATPEDYEEAVKNAPEGALEADEKVYSIANFCQMIITTMAKEQSDETVEEAKQVLLKKASEIEASEYKDSIIDLEHIRESGDADERFFS